MCDRLVLGFLSVLIIFSGLLLPACAAPVPPPAIVEFSSNPATISPNGNSTLLWNVMGATAVSIDQGIGQVNVAGSKQMSPGTTTVYTISATNPTGTVTKSAVITVNSQPVADKKLPLTQIPGYVRYNDETNGFLIYYPEKWTNDPNFRTASSSQNCTVAIRLTDFTTGSYQIRMSIVASTFNLDAMGKMLQAANEQRWTLLNKTPILISQSIPVERLTYRTPEGNSMCFLDFLNVNQLWSLSYGYLGSQSDVLKTYDFMTQSFTLLH